MSAELLYAFDASALVSAALFGQSVPGQALSAALDRGKLVPSRAVVEELQEVLSRKKFDRYLTRQEREQFLQLLVQEARLIEIADEVRVCRDPEDDKYLSLAVSASAACLITGDQDLQILNPFRGIPIVTSAQFLASLSEGAGKEPS